MPRVKGSEDVLSWTPAMEECLVDAYMQQHLSGNRVNGTFTSFSYDNIMKELEEKLGMKIPKTKIHNKWKALKANFTKCYDIMKGASGFSWNPVTKLWGAEPEVWKKLIEANPSAVEWMNKPIPNYEKMVILCGKDRANGNQSETASEMRKRLSNTLEDEDIDPNEVTTDATSSCPGAFEAMVGGSSEAHPRVAPKSSTKKLKKSKLMEETLYIKDSINNLSDSIKDGNSIYLKRYLPSPMPDEEVWQFVEDLGVDEDVKERAFTLLLDRPDKLENLLVCPIERRKSVLMMYLAFGSIWTK